MPCTATDFDPTAPSFAYDDTGYDLEDDLEDEEAEEITQEDCWTVISAFFDQKGLVRQQLDSFDEFVQNTMQELVDENVKEQVRNVLATDVVKAAWSKDPEVRGNAKLVGVHGWVYEIERGRVKDLEVTVYAP